MTQKNPYKKYISMLTSIEQDDLSSIKEKITELSLFDQWTDINQQLLYKAVIHNSHKIIIFLLTMYPLVLSDDTVFNLQILRHAVSNGNVQLVKIMMNNKLLVNSADYMMYDTIIEVAFKCYYSELETSNLTARVLQTKTIIKLLIEYPRHQCRQFGIKLSIDDSMKINLTISEADIIKLYDGKTVLEIYVDRIKVLERHKECKMEYLIQLISNIVFCILKEVVRLKMCKFIVSANNQRVIISNENLFYVAKTFEDEISSMARYNIFDSAANISVKVSDLIADTWVKYSCTGRIIDVILSKEFRDKFPVYWMNILMIVMAANAERSKVMNRQLSFW